MSRTRFITVTPLQLCQNPKKYVPLQPVVNNIMRTFGRLKRMTEMKNSAGTSTLYEVRCLPYSLVRPQSVFCLLLDVAVFNVRWRVTAVGR